MSNRWVVFDVPLGKSKKKMGQWYYDRDEDKVYTTMQTLDRVKVSSFTLLFLYSQMQTVHILEGNTLVDADLLIECFPTIRKDLIAQKDKIMNQGRNFPE